MKNVDAPKPHPLDTLNQMQQRMKARRSKAHAHENGGHQGVWNPR